MKKKLYQKPTMQVDECEHEVELLAASVQSMRSGYGNANSDVEETEVEEGTGTWLWE